MTISNATIGSDVYGEIRTILTSANLIVTNSTTSATTAASINATFNDKSPSKPEVVIIPVSKDESNYKFGSVRGKMFINVGIECYYKSTLGCDQLADQVEHALSTTNINGIELIASTRDYAFNTSNQSKWQAVTLNFTYDRE